MPWSLGPRRRWPTAAPSQREAVARPQIFNLDGNDDRQFHIFVRVPIALPISRKERPAKLTVIQSVETGHDLFGKGQWNRRSQEGEYLAQPYPT